MQWRHIKWGRLWHERWLHSVFVSSHKALNKHCSVGVNINKRLSATHTRLHRARGANICMKKPLSSGLYQCTKGLKDTQNVCILYITMVRLIPDVSSPGTVTSRCHLVIIAVARWNFSVVWGINLTLYYCSVQNHLHWRILAIKHLSFSDFHPDIYLNEPFHFHQLISRDKAF